MRYYCHGEQYWALLNARDSEGDICGYQENSERSWKPKTFQKHTKLRMQPRNGRKYCIWPLSEKRKTEQSIGDSRESHIFIFSDQTWTIADRNFERNATSLALVEFLLNSFVQMEEGREQWGMERGRNCIAMFRIVPETELFSDFSLIGAVNC